ncbi:hypothetical protein BC941DRAFT_351823, partial [Chlamydoabsidia padenii]
MSKLGYPLTFHPTQTQLSPLPINTSSSSSTSSSPATNNEADVDDQVSVSSEPTPVDTGLIQCICESTEDDGFTIQCDRCLTWQHAYCMNITQNTIPDRYLCDDCTQRLAQQVRLAHQRQQRQQQQQNEKKTSLTSHHLMAPTATVGHYPTSPHPRHMAAIVNGLETDHPSILMISHLRPFLLLLKPATHPRNPRNMILNTNLLLPTRSKASLYPSSPICSTTTCKKSRKGAFANTQLYANTFLLEAHGEMLLKSEYKFDAVNDYAILGTPCAHVLFYPTLDLCIDGRRLGNDTRYFRRSCHPNAELRTMVYSSGRTKKEGESSLDDDICQTGDTIIRLGIFTRTTIEPGEEITLGWNWQKGHVSWRKNVEWYRSLIKLDQDDDDYQQEEELATRDAIETMLDRFDIEFGDCACNEHDVCLIERLRQE